MTQDPTYYRVEADVDALFELDNFNADDTVLTVTTQEIPGGPTSPEALDSQGEMRAVRATEQEVKNWADTYARLRATAAEATAELDAAEQVWAAARATATTKLKAAYADYELTQESIEDRLGEADDLREAAENARVRAADAADDDYLGPRDWVVRQVTDPHGLRKTPDMFVPVVHLADCPTLQGKQAAPVRIATAWAKIREGAPEARGGRKRPGTRLHTRLCGRCKPEDSLRAAIGAWEFDLWLAEAEAVQPPAPSVLVLQRELSARIPWADAASRRDGYNYVGTDLYRRHSKIEQHELLLGWVKHPPEGRRCVAEDEPEKLAALYDLLPPLGYAVRPVTEPNVDLRGHNRGGQEYTSRAAVAIRRMTAAERRRHAAAKAAG